MSEHDNPSVPPSAEKLERWAQQCEERAAYWSKETDPRGKWIASWQLESAARFRRMAQGQTK